MVPIDLPRKRTRFLVITLLILTLSVGTAAASTKTQATKTIKKVTTMKTAVSKTKAVAKKSTKKTSSKKTTTKTKSKVPTEVKASIIAADREMVLTDNNIPVSSLLAVATSETPSTSTMAVTNPVTMTTYNITVTTPATVLTYAIPANDIRGYYAQPISGKLSQGIHPFNAVDISAPVGTTVHAAAQGIVIALENDDGYHGGYGNYIVISHPNGTETVYAHLSYVTIHVGDVVTQGQPIAFSGRTGLVTGAHLHFEIRGAVNPWGSDPIGTEYTI
jgi:murein DD-endopeptidase MepM/ murein hydrolase activator NlpD